jgi:amino-acid N-acetyltransferase
VTRPTAASADASPLDARVHLRRAERHDDAVVRSLLREAGLPVEDVAPGRQHFVVAVVDGGVVGCVALERFEGAGLLRSLVVREPHRGSGLGVALVDRIVAVAREQGAERLFLLTTTAATFFARRGFVPVDRSVVPGPMGESAQFAGLCPSTAACMTMAL